MRRREPRTATQFDLDLPFNDMFIEDRWHDGNGDGTRHLFEDLGGLLVFQPDDVLTIDLDKVVLNEYTIAAGGAFLHKVGDLAVLEDEADVTCAVFLHCNGPLKRSGK